MADVRESQNIVEIFTPTSAGVRESQNVIELMALTQVEMRESQNIIELMRGAVDRSGIYYINPTKATKHDSYYNDEERKIPDPTIRTALFGE